MTESPSAIPSPGGALAASVLVLNRIYCAVHVVNVRRAFGLLYRELAEVLDVDDGQYANYDFTSWLEISELRASSKQPHEDWLQSVNFQVQVPRVIRLLRFDRVPKATLRFNRRICSRAIIIVVNTAAMPVRLTC